MRAVTEPTATGASNASAGGGGIVTTLCAAAGIAVIVAAGAFLQVNNVSGSADTEWWGPGRRGPAASATLRRQLVAAADSADGSRGGSNGGAGGERALTLSLHAVRSRLDKIRRLVPAPTDADSQEHIARRRSRRLRRDRVQVAGQLRRPYDPTFNPDDTIFVSICSFRDLQCAPTLYDMYEKARYPRNIFVGAVMQHIVAEDPSCVPPQYTPKGGGECSADSWCPSDNIKTRVIHPSVAKGPTFGRYYGMLMYRDEKYFLMIDSHNRWVTHWDHIVVTMHKGLPVEKGVLAHYPEAWINPEDYGKNGKMETNAPLDNRASVYYMCKSEWIPSLGYVRMGGHIINRKAKFGKDTCRPQPYAPAGFIFSLGRMLREVPFDPHLPYIFDGEEVMYAVRMWTHGWDIFSPSENLLYHYYYREGAKRVWTILPTGWDKNRDAAIRRIQWMLGTMRQNTTVRHVPVDTTEPEVLIEAARYGPGANRTVDAWWDYAGLDRVHYTTYKDFCAEYS